MISFSLTTNLRLADLVRDAQKQEQRVFYRRVNRQVIPRLERRLDRILRIEPAPRGLGSPKFIWSTNLAKQRKAQRWFFKHYPNGYTRTHDLSKAWETSIDFKDGQLSISVENPSPGASFVYGSDEYDQVPGHKTTGWIPIADTVVDVGAELEDDVQGAYEDTMGDLFS